ncbi:uncharacterized protein LOC111608431 [Xiphophorus maculatus]|uniref:uncharacterized protein LOC111608431 n=1 Tax=Xiphophorus maculatus TaxID=8083 RepID=UPI000C6D3DA0|nr:uncharacterized protein LOC111608431 [Xiphophorus maculatus]
MTRTKEKSFCPVCMHNSGKLLLHLQLRHNVTNRTERRLLLALACGRVSVKGMVCPVKRCNYSGNRVDRHLKEVHADLQDWKEHLRRLQRSRTLQLMAELRRSEPQPPLATTLDLDHAQPASVETSSPQPSPDAQQLASVETSSPQPSPDAQQLASVETSSPQPSPDAQQLASVETSSPQPSPDAQQLASVETSSPQPSPDAQQLASVETSSPQPSPDAQPASVEGPGSPILQSSCSEGEEEGEAHAAAAAARPCTVGKRGSFNPPPSIFPPCVCSYLEEFHVHLVGALPRAKHLENCGSKMKRLRAFLSHLSEGKSELRTWQFVDDVRRVMAWPAYLQGQGKAVTTIKVYLVNVTQFLAYFAETPPPDSTLSRAQIVRATRAVKAASSQIATGIVLRQIRVKAAKEQRMVTADLLRRCRTGAALQIPRLLERIEAEPSAVELRHRFFGYFALYVTAIYGHRPGVISNLTTAEVQEARSRASSTSPGFVINVENHKTNRSFGVAQLYLKSDEFQWLTRWIAVRAGLGPSCDLVFFTPGNGPVKKLVHSAQRAWKEMGLAGRPTMTDIRTSVATLARNTQPMDVRSQMSRLMCHDTATADRFYALNLDEKQLDDLRKKFEEATQPASPSPGVEVTLRDS